MGKSVIKWNWNLFNLFSPDPIKNYISNEIGNEPIFGS